MSKILCSERLVLRPLTHTDTKLVQKLFNQADCLKYIGDRNIHNEQDARDYLTKGPLASYQQFGFGMLAVETKEGQLAGLCGLLKREHLHLPDIGYALLSEFQGKGYIEEACQTILSAYPEIKQVLALTHPDNIASQKILQKLGFCLQQDMTKQLSELSHPSQQPTHYFLLSR